MIQLTNPSLKPRAGSAAWMYSRLVARAGGRQRYDSDHCVMPTGAKLAGTFALDLLTATELQLDRHTHPTAVSVPVPLHLSGSNALRRKGTRKSVTLGITPHRASGSGCGSNRDVPACLKHSGASPGKARCSELIAIDAQSTSPHDLPDVLGCAWMRLPAQEVRALFDSWLRAARVKL